MSYGLTTPDDMAEHIKQLEKACREWSKVSQKNYQRAKAAEAKLAAEEQKGYANAMEAERKIHEERIEELEAAIKNSKYFLEMHPAYSDADCRVLIKKALVELKREDRG